MRAILAGLALIMFLPLSAFALAFPTAEGFGAVSQGGRGGTVYHVTNTSPSGTGSLRACVEDDLGVGARTCIFRVGGVVDLFSAGDSSDWISITDPFLTIAGQTAPGQGFGMRRGNFLVRSNDIIIRYFRSWFGYHRGLNEEGDAISLSPSGGQVPDNFIIDHSTLAWGFDSDVEIWGASTNTTFQWNIIAESLHCLGTPSDPCTSRAFLTGASTTNLTVHHNLIVHHNQRVPHWKSGSGQWINNFTFNGRGCQFKSENEVHLDFVRNYFEIYSPPAGVQKICLMNNDITTGPSFVGSTLYLLGNIDTDDRPTDTGAEDLIVYHSGTLGDFMDFTTTRHFSALVSETSAVDARTAVLARAGPRLFSFAPYEQRLLNEIAAETGPGGAAQFEYVFLPSDSGIGGFPTLSSGTAYPDTDVDGIDDNWETLCSTALGGLSPSNGGDGNDIISGIHAAVNGYSKLEVFLNELAGDYDSSPGAGDGENTCGTLLAQGDITDPSVSITEPTTDPTYLTSTDPITTLAGTAGDDTGVTSVTWENTTTAGSGSASGCTTGLTSCSWTIATMDLAEGENIIEVTAHDAAANTSAVATITVSLIDGVLFIGDGTIDSVSGLTSLSFVGDGNIDSITGLSALPIIDDGVIDSVSGLTSIGFIGDGTIDSVSID